jgi:uncharacterized membrane protein
MTTATRPVADLSPAVRAAAGLAPAAPAAPDGHELAFGVHLASVLPAIPLGLYVLLTRKDGTRQRMLGKLWMALMVSGALSALFIRHANYGGFSWIHIFVPVTVLAAIASARAGRISQHCRRVIAMYLDTLIVPVLFAFAPGRVMWTWTFG